MNGIFCFLQAKRNFKRTERVYVVKMGIDFDVFASTFVYSFGIVLAFCVFSGLLAKHRNITPTIIILSAFWPLSFMGYFICRGIRHLMAMRR